MKKKILTCFLIGLLLNTNAIKANNSTQIGYTPDDITTENSSNGSVNTGDTTNTNQYVVGLLIAIGVVSALIITKKLKDKKDENNEIL